MNNRYYATSCEFRLIEDDYEKGELSTISIWNENVNPKKAESVKDILENVPYLWCNAFGSNVHELFQNDPVEEGDYSRFDADLQVGVNGDDLTKPSDEDIELWKKGEAKIYALHITLYIRKLTDLSKDDVKF